MLSCLFTLFFFAKAYECVFGFDTSVLYLFIFAMVYFPFCDNYGIVGHAVLFRFMCFVMCFLYCRTILGLLRGIAAAERYGELFNLG